MVELTKREFLRVAAGVGVAGLAGCAGGSGGNGGAEPPADGGTATTGEPSTADPADTPTTAASGPPVADRQPAVMWDFETLRHSIASGGVPKDGIPSIDEPTFVGPDEVQGLDPGSIVFGYAGEADVVAYPQRILVKHEIVNDTLDGRPVSVTYCPLTGTVLGFERGETEFGVSGDLLNNNLVMYDRATDSRWPQILGTAVEGRFAREALREFRLVWTTWKQWQRAHPDTVVLSTDTGYALNYDKDPYGQYNPAGGYYTSERTLFPPIAEDDRYHPKEVVVGTRVPEGALAVPKESLAGAGTLDGTIGETTVTAVYDARLETAYVYRNPEAVAITVSDGTATVDGAEHPPDALPLERVHAFDAMWFAWSGFYPDTEVLE